MIIPDANGANTLPALGIAAALGSALSWSLGSIMFGKLAQSLPAEAMTAAKGFLSIVLLAVVMMFTGNISLATWPLAMLLLSGVLGIAIGDTLFFKALAHVTPHTVVTMMMLGHVLTVVGAFLLLGESPSPVVWVGIGCVLGGIFVVLQADLSSQEGAGENHVFGLVCGFLSVCAMSASILIAKKALDTTPTIQATLIRMVGGTIGILLAGTFSGKLLVWARCFKDPRIVLPFTGAVAVITFGGFWLSMFAIKHADVMVANTLLSTEPLFVLFIATFFLRKKITARALLGSLLTVAGVFLICKAALAN